LPFFHIRKKRQGLVRQTTGGIELGQLQDLSSRRTPIPLPLGDHLLQSLPLLEEILALPSAQIEGGRDEGRSGQRRRLGTLAGDDGGRKMAIDRKTVLIRSLRSIQGLLNQLPDHAEVTLCRDFHVHWPCSRRVGRPDRGRLGRQLRPESRRRLTRPG